jgi:8-oxo-dGTP pyrophosphatase MutT (NUDIX family)
MSCYTNEKIKNGASKHVSYGVILYKKNEIGDPSYCLICRRHTYAYGDFIQGKYQLEDKDRIYKIFQCMTTAEKVRIHTTSSFELLWQQYWNTTNTRHYTRELKIATHKYNMLVKGYDILVPMTAGVKVTLHLDLGTILRETAVWAQRTPEWGFPKGKKNKDETPLMCAQRELAEETNLEVATLDFCDPTTTFVEMFLGTNGVKYEHVYYVAKCRDGNTHLHYNPTNVNQLMEISDIGWFSFEECLQMFRDRDVAKKNVLVQVHSSLK